MEAQRTVKSLFELNAAEFVESIIGVTNGKEGLARMMANQQNDNDHNHDDDPALHKRMARASIEDNNNKNHEAVGDGGDDDNDDKGVEVALGLTCRSCAITFTRFSFLLSFLFFSSFV
jgi:hypothetical protein